MLLIRYCLLLLRIKSFSPTVLVILKLPSLQHQNLLMVQLGKGKTLQSDHGLVYRQMSALSFSVKISLFSPFQLPLVPGYQLSPTLISRKLFYYYFFFYLNVIWLKYLILSSSFICLSSLAFLRTISLVLCENSDFASNLHRK